MIVKKFSISLYFLFLFLTALIITLIWSLFIDGNLYYCSDKIPFLDFFPPFVHTSPYGPTGDFFITSPVIVWVVWVLFIGLIFSIPYFLTRSFKLKKSINK